MSNVKTPAVATHCPYCALQCGMHATAENGAVTVAGNPRFPVNKGGLCLKGWTAPELLGHQDRLRTPLVRSENGDLAPATWSTALQTIGQRIRRVQTQHGRNAVAVLGGGSLTNEKAYLIGKFARVALRTANVDYNGRFCMSSAAAAAQLALGIDRGLPFPIEDIALPSVILVVGANPAETMPPIMQYFERQRESGGQLIVADPRHTATAAWGTLHLPLRPGSDAALANGLLHILIREGWLDRDFIETRTEDFEEARRVATAYWPERVERITGVPERDLLATARLLGEAPSAMILTARGPEQQSQGVSNALAFINVALALGLPGKPRSGIGTLTGQGNGQGGREHGQKADQLPGYRKLTDPVARKHVAAIWRIDEADLPGPGKSAFEILDAMGREIHALIVIGFNPAVSAPEGARVLDRLTALDTLVVADFFPSETARLADVILPSAQWAEEDGTMTNLEGRVIRRRRVIDPPANVRSDLDILAGLAAAVGSPDGFSYGGPSDVFDELARATAGGVADYAGISYERLDREDGLHWPCPSPGHAGTPRLFEHDFPTISGRAKFHATPHHEPQEICDDAFPLHLTTGRVLAHYQSGNQTRRIEELRKAADEPAAEMHPRAAARAGVAEGDRVVLSSRRGSAEFVVRLTPSIREDTVFLPFHWGDERAANRLTHAALDPTSRMPEFKVCAVRADAVPPRLSAKDDPQ